MSKQPMRQSHDLDGERVRRLRLRADGRRPLAVNLKETISLTRKLFELRDAARRALAAERLRDLDAAQPDRN
jgi:hypothetical protein